MLLSGSIGGPESSLRYSVLHQRDNSKCVCRGCYFYSGMPDPIPSAHFFFFFHRLWLFLCLSSFLSHPARLIQLIFIQSKYESTKINLSCLRIKSAVLLWRCDAGLHTRGWIVKRLSCIVIFFCLHSVPARMLSCLCYVRAYVQCVSACACACACLYVGTTCYSQGWSSLTLVSLCVYSSGGLLPPDYKKEWWINNIQLSLALAHSLWGLEVCVCVCVCWCLVVSMCTYVPAPVCGFLCAQCDCVSIPVCNHMCHSASVSVYVCVCECIFSISQRTRSSFI